MARRELVGDEREEPGEVGGERPRLAVREAEPRDDLVVDEDGEDDPAPGAEASEGAGRARRWSPSCRASGTT